MNILITGGSGGIGLALVQACLERFPEATVEATYCHRASEYNHKRLNWHCLDLTNESQIEGLAKQLDKLDWIINAAGMLHSSLSQPEKTVKKFAPEFFIENIQKNAIPSLLLAKHFQMHLKASNQSLFTTISAKVGSISDNQLGGWYSYRASKAALNMALKTLSIEWQRSLSQCCVAALHPGTTDTSLSKPFQGNVPTGKLFSPEKTAGLLVDIMQSLTPEQTGRFWSWDGSELPW